MVKAAEERLEKFRNGELTMAEVFKVNAKEVAALLLTGHNLYEQGRFEDAKNIFEGLVTLDSGNPYLHGVLGSIYQIQEKYEIAVTFYDAALTLFAEDIRALTNRGEIYLKLGKFEEAAADFKRAIELDLNRKHPAANRARLLVSFTLQALELAKQKGMKAVLEARKATDRQIASE
ncbi:tetratricopeptide repeat protein [bacterium]|nr:tetratricopeptide repeat protein [bacterium]